MSGGSSLSTARWWPTSCRNWKECWLRAMLTGQENCCLIEPTDNTVDAVVYYMTEERERERSQYTSTMRVTVLLDPFQQLVSVLEAFFWLESKHWSSPWSLLQQPPPGSHHGALAGTTGGELATAAVSEQPPSTPASYLYHPTSRKLIPEVPSWLIACFRKLISESPADCCTIDYLDYVPFLIVA